MALSTLSTTQDASTSLEDLLLDVQSTPIGPIMPSPREILHNRTTQHPGKQSTPVDMGMHLKLPDRKKQSQKQYFNRAHNTKEMKQLDPS